MKHDPKDYPVIEHVRAANPEPLPPDTWVRSAFPVGNGLLSVQASSKHFCSPKVDGLDIAEYDSVEVLIYWGEPGSPVYHTLDPMGGPDTFPLRIWCDFKQYAVFPDAPWGGELTLGWPEVQALADRLSAARRKAGWERWRPT